MRFVFRRSAIFVASLILLSPIGCVAETTQQAPDFTLQNLDGKPVSLSSFKGKVVILDFWATWCPPCQMEIPHFQELYKQYQPKGLEIVGISLDEGGVEGVRRFLEEYAVTYTNVMGNRKVASLYGGIRSIPTTFVIDRQGRIVKKFIGYQDKENIERTIQPLL